MCFSATGSFIAAAINVAAGGAALRRTAGTSEGILAALPFTFAAQQAIEGFLWMDIPNQGGAIGATALGTSFVFIALAIWPAFSPFAAFLLERDRARRRILTALFGLGLGFGLYYAAQILEHPFGARIIGHSISYSNGVPFPLPVALLYCVCTCLPLLISTQGSLKLLGLCVLTGLVASYALFFYSFLSVWCFFAALASALVFFRAYFEFPRVSSEASA
ncbi:MAG TPA: DUF6629 family protein [Rhizomicrobium sp.]|nr:DUF6629 family protein [Rhizomicrobium sp.]